MISSALAIWLIDTAAAWHPRHAEHVRGGYRSRGVGGCRREPSWPVFICLQHVERFRRALAEDDRVGRMAARFSQIALFNRRGPRVAARFYPPQGPAGVAILGSRWLSPSSSGMKAKRIQHRWSAVPVPPEMIVLARMTGRQALAMFCDRAELTSCAGRAVLRISGSKPAVHRRPPAIGR